MARITSEPLFFEVDNEFKENLALGDDKSVLRKCPLMYFLLYVALISFCISFLMLQIKSVLKVKIVWYVKIQYIFTVSRCPNNLGNIGAAPSKCDHVHFFTMVYRQEMVLENNPSLMEKLEMEGK